MYKVDILMCSTTTYNSNEASRKERKDNLLAFVSLLSYLMEHVRYPNGQYFLNHLVDYCFACLLSNLTLRVAV